jgi:broad specificity phosphatase PhoE
MSQIVPVVYLARHGETAWTITGQHTGRTDLPLTERGADMARRLGERLTGATFAKVFTSPLRRSVQTCQLAGFGAVAELDPDLLEWDYGEYEGLTSAQIRERRPDWNLWRDGCPGGESPADVGERADRVIARLGERTHAALFSHGHMLRVLGARWIALEPAGGAHLGLSPGAICDLGHERATPILATWNQPPPAP